MAFDLCKDCKWLETSMHGAGFCSNPKLGIDPVSGGVEMEYAGAVRDNFFLCGWKGLWFEPAPPRRSWWQKLFKL